MTHTAQQEHFFILSTAVLYEILNCEITIPIILGSIIKYRKVQTITRQHVFIKLIAKPVSCKILTFKEF